MILKCKMCGGTLNVSEGSTVCECEFCGTKQTIPIVKDEVTINLFNRANNLRLKSEFDKAETIYEKIVQEDDSNAEAHWGIVLCKYGIEYVDDPLTKKKVPTCHRTLYNAITADPDYQAAVDYSDTLQQSIYESEARAIDKIQKDILAIVKNENPFDVFICYKETDDDGKRTVDSVIANDIYYQLTQEGFKVFYAAITLEDKLGQEYEPYIFAALNSAKVMLSIGTKPEYFTSVWVKNEWSRFLSLMKTDRNKLLIPCYRDMDAYDLPEEFSHLQAQDMSKIGFINDIVRGINKVIKTNESKQDIETTIVKEISLPTNADMLLKRSFLFLEDRDWDNANIYAEKLLDNDPENGEAYLVKLLADLKVASKNELIDLDQMFNNNINYQKVIRFGNNSLVSELENINNANIIKNEEKRYNNALSILNKQSTTEELSQAKELLLSIPEYKDAASLIENCDKKIEELQKYYKNIKDRQKEAKKRTILLYISLSAIMIVFILFMTISPNTQTKKNYDECFDAERGTPCSIDAYVLFNGYDFGENFLLLSSTETLDDNLIYISDISENQVKTLTDITHKKIKVIGNRGYNTSFIDYGKALILDDVKIDKILTDNIKLEPIDISSILGYTKVYGGQMAFINSYTKDYTFLSINDFQMSDYYITDNYITDKFNSEGYRIVKYVLNIPCADGSEEKCTLEPLLITDCYLEEGKHYGAVGLWRNTHLIYALSIYEK